MNNNMHTGYTDYGDYDEDDVEEDEYGEAFQTDYGYGEDPQNEQNAAAQTQDTNSDKPKILLMGLRRYGAPY